MTVPRQVIADRTYLLSRRCTQRQYLLRPDPVVEQSFLYCLGEAAQRFDITLHGWIAMSNHEHLLFRDNRGNFPKFLGHLHKMIAKVINSYRGRWENLWATEQPNAVYLVNAEDRFDKLIYLLTNPVADHLVEDVAHWPGASSLRLHFGAPVKTVKRPRNFFREDGKMPEEITLKLERPDGFEHLTEQEWRDKLTTAINNVQMDARRERAITGRSIVGRKNILRASPTDSPNATEPRRNLRPHVACRNTEQRKRELETLRAFRRAHRAALLRFREGERNVEFPQGTYWMSQFRTQFVLKDRAA